MIYDNTSENKDLPYDILIVDDVPDNLTILREILERRGYRVRPTLNGTMALKAAQKNPPDLILLDIMMPGLDGYEVCQRLKADATTRDIPVLFTSALNETANKVKGFEVGGVDFVTKPFEATELLARVKIHLALRTAQKQLEAQNARLAEEMAERERITIALQESLEKYRVLFESFPMGITISDKSGQIVESNREAKRLLEISSTEHTKRQIDGQEWRIIRPDGTPMPAEEFASVRALNENRLIENVEMGIIKEEGQVTWINVTAAPIPLATYGVAIVYGDITARKRVEDALRKSEQRYRSLFENMTAGFALHEMIYDQHGQPIDYRFLEANPAFEKLTGLKAATLLGRTVKEVLPNTKQYWIEIYGKVARTGEPLAYQNYSQELGKHYDVWAFSPTLGQFAVIVTDITERKQVEETIKYLASFPERNPNPIVEIDLNGDIQYLNPAATKLFSDLEVRYQDNWFIDLQAVVNELKNKQVASITREVAMGDAYYQQTVQYNDQDQRIRIYGLDITARKKMENEWRKLSRAVDQSSNSIVITNLEGIIEFVNTGFTKVTGYTLEESLGNNPRVLKSGCHSPEFYQALWATIEQGESWHGELINKKKNGELYWESANISPIKDAHGHITHYVAVKENITARKQVELELQQAKEIAEAANRSKSIFLAAMSHELRTPLNGVLGYVQILKRDEDVTETQRNGLAVIEQSGNHLLGLINDILDLSKIEAGKIELTISDIYLPNFLQSVNEIIQVKTVQKGIAFDFESDPAMPQFIQGDERRLRQVLINLLGNAVKFTEKGRVRLAVMERPMTRPPTTDRPMTPISFTISDTGIGIATADLVNLFEPFKQVGAERYKMQGSGLGLVISRNLIRLMGGELQVTSELGKGTTFSFELTVPTKVEATIPIPQNNQQIIGVVEPAPKILIVDDNEANRLVLVELLSKLGFQMEQATDGREGLAKIAEFAPQLIITDLRMPIMDGLTLIKELRHDDFGVALAEGNLKASFEIPTQSKIENRKSKIVIVASSASVYDEDKYNSIQAGADDFLPKPVEVGELLRILQQHLKLTWRYGYAVPKVEETVPPKIIAPSADLLVVLMDFALMGDIGGLRGHAIALQEDESLKPFGVELEKLAKKFQLKKIREMLQFHLTGESGDV